MLALSRRPTFGWVNGMAANTESKSSPNNGTFGWAYGMATNIVAGPVHSPGRCTTRMTRAKDQCLSSMRSAILSSALTSTLPMQ
eukprot:82450-Chlamydomonas_euryale.AAC.4